MPGAGGAGGGYCAITEYVPDTVVKWVLADVMKAFKNGSDEFDGGTGIGDHAPGDKTIPNVVVIFFIEPGDGIIGGGNNIICPPVQYDITAGPTTSNNPIVFDNCVCINRDVNVASIADTFPVINGI